MDRRKAEGSRGGEFFLFCFFVVVEWLDSYEMERENSGGSWDEKHDNGSRRRRVRDGWIEVEMLEKVEERKGNSKRLVRMEKPR